MIMMSKLSLAKRIKEIYDFNDYELKSKNLEIIVDRITFLIEKYKLKDYNVDLFFEMLEHGQLGNIQKSPLSFLCIFWNFQNSKIPKLAGT